MRITPLMGGQAHNLHIINGHGLAVPNRVDHALILAAEQITDNTDTFARVSESLDLVQRALHQGEQRNLATMKSLVNKQGEFGPSFGTIVL